IYVFEVFIFYIGYFLPQTFVVHAAAPPVTAFVALAPISVAVIDPTVEPDMGTPIARVPEKYHAVRPPIAGGPYVPLAGNRRLVVYREFGRGKIDRNIHGHLCRRQRGQYQQEQRR